MDSVSLYIVMTKKVILNLRIKPEIRDEFNAVAELRGSSMSGLLHQFIVKSIREEKTQDLGGFNLILEKVIAEKPNEEKERDPSTFEQAETPAKGILATKITLVKEEKSKKEAG